MNKSLEIIKDNKVLPLLAMKNIETAEKFADILVQNNIPICEIGLRNENAFELIKILGKRKDILLGGFYRF